MTPLVVGMRVCLVDHIDRSEKCLLRDKSGVLRGWVVDEREQKHKAMGDTLLQYPPKVLYVKFDDASWLVEGMAEAGAYPVTPIKKYWHVDPQGKTLKVRRTQQPVAPDYTRTAYNSQGMTLAAAVVDLCFDANMDPEHGLRSQRRRRRLNGRRTASACSERGRLSRQSRSERGMRRQRRRRRLSGRRTANECSERGRRSARGAPEQREPEQRARRASGGQPGKHRC